MSCSVDAVAWGEKNRVALATGKTQEWVLARTTRDAPTLASLPETARAVMVKWFAGTPLDTMFADAGSSVDDVHVTAVSETAPVPKSTDQRRESLDPVPLLATSSSPPLYVSLRFNYRGYAKSLPWPVWTASVSLFKSDKLCPTSADWMLVSARDAGELAAAPDEASALEKLSTHAPPALAGLADITRIAGWGIGIYVAVQALGFVRAIVPSAPARRSPGRSSRSRRYA